MPERFAIRVASPEDSSGVETLLRASYPALMRGSYDAAALEKTLPLMTRANPHLLSSGTYYLAENGAGLAVGCGGWTKGRPGTGEIDTGLAHIRHFGTHPEWTGHGIGRAIFARCETEARAAGVRRFECYSSLNAEAFYAKLGFKQIRRLEIDMGPDMTLPSILMKRDI